MPQTDPIEVLISQGYTPDIAKKMVESGAYSKMNQQIPLLPGLDSGSQVTPPTNSQPILPELNNTNTEKEFSRNPDIQKLIDEGYTREEAWQMSAADQLPTENTGVSPEIQGFLDQGYNMDEAQQLSQSKTYSGNQNSVDQAESNKNTSMLDKGRELLDFSMNSGVGSGVSLDQAAYGLGSAIGAEKGSQGRGLAIAANAGKLVLGSARGIASGIGRSKRDNYIREYQDKKNQEATGRTTYTAAPQSGDVNYLGGNSYGEQGGIQGKTLPIKDFLKNKGFRKPGFKKLP